MSTLGTKVTEEKRLLFYINLVKKYLGIESYHTTGELTNDSGNVIALVVRLVPSWLTVEKATVFFDLEGYVRVQLILEQIEKEILQALGESYLRGVIEREITKEGLSSIDIRELHFTIKTRKNCYKDVCAIVSQLLEDVKKMKEKVFQEIADETLKSRIIADKLKP
jgi:RNA:NAD 2'-phosphotransferase (TPT1/KptA family)